MEEVTFKEQPAILDPAAFDSPAHGIPPSSSLKRAKLALLRSKVLILLIALLPPRRILNSSISWSLQHGLLKWLSSFAVLMEGQKDTGPEWRLKI